MVSIGLLILPCNIHDARLQMLRGIESTVSPKFKWPVVRFARFASRRAAASWCRRVLCGLLPPT